MLILEEWEHAVGRGATILGEIARRGEQRRRPPHHGAVAGRRRGDRRACASRSRTPGSRRATSRQVNAHGTSTPLNDAAEAEAVAHRVRRRTARRSRRSRASPATPSAPPARSRRRPCCCRSQHRLIPPTANTKVVDLGIDVVTGDAREWEPGPTISNNFGFGGHNGSRDPRPRA